MKPCLILNTFNEGRDVADTIASFRNAAGECTVDVVVVADGTGDGSCDRLSDDILVIKPTERVGCGRAKHIGVMHARKHFKPDVIVHADAHNRLLRGTVEEMGELCLRHEPAVLSPMVGPLNCMSAAKCPRHGTKVCNIDCPDIKETEEIPPNCFGHGTIELGADGLFARHSLKKPRAAIEVTGAVNPSSFAYSVKTLDAIGGWNKYPGWWGAQELGVSLRCAFSGTPILVLRDIVVLHRYRSWNRKDQRAIAPYSIPEHHRDVNMRYASRVVFSQETWTSTWQPWFDRRRPDAEADKWLANGTDVEPQRNEFSRLKKVEDDEFFRDVLKIEPPHLMRVEVGARRALYAVSAGLGNALMCIPAIKLLARATGEPVDVWDKGLVQGTAARELLAAQEFIRKVVTEEPDLKEYKWIVGSYWARTPHFLPVGSATAEAKKGWRTRHEVECNLDAVNAAIHGMNAPDCDVERSRGPAPDMSLSTWNRISLPFKDYVAVGVGCASFHEKKWPFWKECCEILKANNVNLVFIGGQDDDEPWMDRMGHNLCGKTSLLQAAGVLDLARFYIGIDNGLSHLAAGVNRPMILLYGPSSERKNKPWTTSCRVLRSGTFKCEPCWGRTTGCNEKPRPCMAAIRPQYVANQVMMALERPAWYFGPTGPLYMSQKQSLENTGAQLRQDHGEFMQLIGMLRSEQVVNVCEIGCADGGWFGVLSGCLPGPLNILCIDPDPNAHPHPKECPKDFPRPFANTVEKVRAAGHHVTHIKKKSEDATADAAEWIAKHGKLDVLHIDGDHDFEPCMADFLNYKKMVRPGGFIVVHDVRNRRCPDVRKAFEQVRGRYDLVLEFSSPNSRKLGRGIGVIQVSKEDGTKR